MGSFRFVLVVATLWFLQTTWGEETCHNVGIIGGHNVSIEDVPFIAAVIEDDEVICAGAIIHDSFILTAASCFSKAPQKVLVGTVKLNKGGKYYEVRKKICHHKYNTVTMENDICLLHLRRKINFRRSRAGKVLMPHSYTNIPDGHMLNVTGWGSIDPPGKHYPNEVQQTMVPKISNHCCSEEYDDITDSMICAGQQGHDACDGDAGAPLTVDNLLIGIYSTGEECGSSTGIYTKVAAYLHWINSKIKEYA